MLKKLFLLALLFSIASICFAQDTGEQITITTYYPSPYGVYKTLRLFPNTDVCGVASSCDSQYEGAMCYNDSTNTAMMCRQTGADTYAWEALGGGAATIEVHVPDSFTDNVTVGSYIYRQYSFYVNPVNGMNKAAITVRFGIRPNSECSPCNIAYLLRFEGANIDYLKDNCPRYGLDAEYKYVVLTGTLSNIPSTGAYVRLYVRRPMGEIADGKAILVYTK